VIPATVRCMGNSFIAGIPALLRAFAGERKRLEQILAENKFDSQQIRRRDCAGYRSPGRQQKFERQALSNQSERHEAQGLLRRNFDQHQKNGADRGPGLSGHRIRSRAAENQAGGESS
jgi:hypothetical protein